MEIFLSLEAFNLLNKYIKTKIESKKELKNLIALLQRIYELTPEVE